MNNGKNSAAFGVDLGTTNSVAAFYRHGKVEMVVDRNGSCITPSYVCFPANGNPPYICGFIAKDRIKTRPKEVIHNCKRLIGVKYRDPIVKTMQNSVAFPIVDDGNDKPMVVVKQNDMKRKKYPEQISSYILEHLKNLTQTFAGFPIQDVVITVPARYTQIQRQIVRDAATIAGLNTLDIIPEPVAAAYAYADVLNIGDGEHKEEKNVLIYDLGGGTFDVTIMKINGTDFTELALGGDPLLGGSDFDRLIRDDVIRKYREDAEEEYGELEKKDIDKLLKKCEDAKIELRALSDTEIEVNEDIDWKCNLTRAYMNALIKDRIDESIRLCDEAIAKAGLTAKDIDDIVLVGGSTRLLIVEEKLRAHFPQLAIRQTVNPDECVAVGAAKYAYALTNHMGVPIFHSVNPNDVPSEADQPQRPDPLIPNPTMGVIPICPSNIGIQGSKGEMLVLIKAGERFPCEGKITVYNTEDFVKSIPLRMYQGNDPLCVNNTLLNQVSLRIKHPGRAGEHVFEISCSMDRMGNLTLGVWETSMPGSEKLILNVKTTWTKEEVDSLRRQMQQDTAELEAYTILQERANRVIGNAYSRMDHLSEDQKRVVNDLIMEWNAHQDKNALEELERILG